MLIGSKLLRLIDKKLKIDAILGQGGYSIPLLMYTPKTLKIEVVHSLDDHDLIEMRIMLQHGQIVRALISFFIHLLLKLYRTMYLAKFDYIIAVSKGLLRECYRYYPILRAKKNALVIPNGAPQEIYGLGIEERRGREYDFIYVGTLTPRKRVDLIIKAVKILKHLNYRCKVVIVGDGEQNDYLRKLARNLGVSESTIFLGHIGEGVKYKYISQSRFLILPSEVEGDPIVVKEALSLGVPCIVSNIDALKDLIIDGYNGFVFKRGNVRDLALKMKEALLINEELYEKMSENARKSVNIYSWINIVKLYLKLIRITKRREAK